MTGGQTAQSSTQANDQGKAAVEWVSSTDPQAKLKLEPAAAAVFEFLSAMRAGDDTKTAAMLTSLAQAKCAELGIPLTASASDTARFELGKTEYLAEDGARVACRWTDLDENGRPQTEHALWMVRREAAGWRIAGAATWVLEGEDPLLLNYEDPADTIAKLQQLAEEQRRRAEAAQAQAQGPAGRGDSIQR